MIVRMGDREAPSRLLAAARAMRLLVARVALPACLSLAPAAAADAPAVLRIGTGGEHGTYFPVGTLIARALSDAGARCPPAQTCGVPGLLAVAQISNGSVSNVEGIADALLEAALAQADVAWWAYTGSGIFAGETPRSKLRAVANLYPESVHIVARRDPNLRTVGDLRGRRVSLDEPGSGTLVDARIVIRAYGLGEQDLEPVYLKPQFAAEMLLAGKLDAFFIVGGYPARSVSDIARFGDVTLLAVQGAPAASVVDANPFFAPDVIPAGTYPGIPETRTLNVGAQLLVHASLAEALVYAITKVLWSERTRDILTGGHPKGEAIRRERALDGIGVPLHPGAARYYRELGMAAE